MIPLRDSTRSRTFPWLTVGFIVINVLVWAYELSLDRQELARFFFTWGLVPKRLMAELFLGAAPMAPGLPPAWLTAVTSTFIHGGWLHIIGNMLYLWVFGDNVEDRLGRPLFLVFYLAGGAAAGLAHVLAGPGAMVPTVGASGAVAGVLGAYFIAFPRARVLTLVPLGFFLTLVEVPALLFLVIWFLIQFISGIASLGVASQIQTGVAWWAHIGGFVVGVAVMAFVRATRRRRV